MRHTGHGQKNVFHAEKNKNDLKGENGSGKQQKICEKKNNASPHTLMAFIEKKQSAEADKEFRHRAVLSFTRSAEGSRGLPLGDGLLFKVYLLDDDGGIPYGDVAVKKFFNHQRA
jgi:hypothetical protein